MKAISFEIQQNMGEETDQEFFDLIQVMIGIFKIENQNKIYIGNEVSS